MRYLLVGGAGYIGSNVAALLKAQSKANRVWVYDDFSSGTRNKAVKACDKVVVGDQLDTAKLKRTMAALKPDVVMHFAAKIVVSQSVSMPLYYWQNNVGGMTSVLEAMRETKVRRLVFSSTAAVYGNPRTVPVKEDDYKDPINPYGSSKLACEYLIKGAAEAYGLSAAVFRYFNVAGASADGELGIFNSDTTLLIPRLAMASIQGKPITVFGTDWDTKDGTCVRDFIHVLDLAQAHLDAVPWLKANKGVLTANLGTGRGYSVKECVSAIEKASGKPLQVKEMPRRPGDPATLITGHEAATRHLG